MKLNLDFVKPLVVFLQYFSVLFFMIATTLLVGFNHKMFTRVAGERTKPLWWIFVLFTAPLLMVVLFIFGLIFGKINFIWLFKVILGKA